MRQSKVAPLSNDAVDQNVRESQRGPIQVTKVEVTERVFRKTAAQELINPPSFPRLREVSKAG